MPASEDPDDAAVTHERYAALSSPGPGFFPTGDRSPSGRTEISSEPMHQHLVDQNYHHQGDNDYENPFENFNQLAFGSGIHRSFFFLFLFHKFSFHKMRKSARRFLPMLFPGVCLFSVRIKHQAEHYDPNRNDHE
jgi:hypothetical protein